MAIRITTCQQAFENVLGIKYDDKWKEFIIKLEKDGHTEKSISYSIWRSQEKLLRFKRDPRFIGILHNEINKWSWVRDDPRWKEYNKKKSELEKVASIQHANNIKLEEERKKLEIGYVYFVQGECGGSIKIGHSQNPKDRLKGLQTGYPDTLIILFMMPGSEQEEFALHEKFRHIKLNGEWFKPEKELIDEIERLKQIKNL